MRACRLSALAAGMAVSLGVAAGTAPPASASANQMSIIQDPARLLADPSGTLATFRALGVNTVRVIVVWAQIAPDWQNRAARCPRDSPTAALSPARLISPGVTSAL